MANSKSRSKWTRPSSSNITNHSVSDHSSRRRKPFSMKFANTTCSRRHSQIVSVNDGKDRCRTFKDQGVKNRKFYKNNAKDERKRKLFYENNKSMAIKQVGTKAMLPPSKTILCRAGNKVKATDHRTTSKRSEPSETKVTSDKNEKTNEILDSHHIIHGKKRIVPPLPLLFPLTTMLVTPARAGLLPTPRFGSGIISCLPNPNKTHQAQALTLNKIANNAAALQALKEPHLLTNFAGKRKQPSNSIANNNTQTALINFQPSTVNQKIRSSDASIYSIGKPTISCLPLPAPTANTVLIPSSTAPLLSTDNATSVALVSSVANIISTGNVSLLTSANCINTTATAIPLLANAAIVQTQTNIPIITNPIGIAATQAAVALANSTNDILPPHTINGQEKPKPKVDPPAAVLEKAAQLKDKLRATQAVSALRLSSQLQNINSLASSSLVP
ncbi:uncharacterized protein TRIADDRAFT_63988 [Trichoplax adhaerens]|uniref:Uncharacterized protein n=1 Tax=Trichoplax adhaerens TaxID=10228 RepID=B3S0L6_TRIAD|nr:predicted protein [Trichoplax adhaerens]EDV23662.1 predicted protein [Trichoplax adhaerens]|eukprot:XP_002113188.1 predicted protein [Trichoplax adhaerens]